MPHLQMRKPVTLRFLIHVVVASLVVPLLLVTVASTWGRWQVRTAARELTAVVLPASAATAGLTKGFVDQETGERGYLLAGQPDFLEPYRSGSSDVTRWHAELARLVAGDQETLGALEEVMRAGQTWRTHVAEPQIALRQRGDLSADVLAAETAGGKQLFDVLRTRLSALQSRMDELTEEQLRLIADAQSLANLATIVAVGVALVAVCCAMLIVQRGLTRPLRGLLVQVAAVASGQHDRRIGVVGPGELVTIAGSVDAMREELVAGSRELVRTQHELTVRAEQERVAGRVRDRTLRQLSALGVELSSVAARNPRLADVVSTLARDTDTIIKDLGEAIYGRSDGVPAQRGGGASTDDRGAVRKNADTAE